MSIPVPAKYIADFEKRGFGMFIHWGLYSQLAQGEWTMNLHHISQEKYTELFNNFTAEDFDAKKIVALAKQAGMKYITLTTRHHDGFSLYDTRADGIWSKNLSRPAARKISCRSCITRP